MKSDRVSCNGSQREGAPGRLEDDLGRQVEVTHGRRSRDRAVDMLLSV